MAVCLLSRQVTALTFHLAAVDNTSEGVFFLPYHCTKEMIALLNLSALFPGVVVDDTPCIERSM